MRFIVLLQEETQAAKWAMISNLSRRLEKHMYEVLLSVLRAHPFVKPILFIDLL